MTHNQPTPPETAPSLSQKPETPAPAGIRRGRSSNLEMFRRMITQPKALIGIIILIFYFAIALLAPIIAPGDPNRLVVRQNQPPSAKLWLGSTGQGQDVYKELVWGARMSLMVGFSVGLLSTLLGLAIGMVAGYMPGLLDGLLNLFTNVFLIIPGLPLLITLASFLPPGPLTVVMVLTFTGWAWPARVFRSQTLTLREKDFVYASVVSGEGWGRIIFSEILPNMLSLVVESFFGAVVYAIGADAGLAFLGFENVNTVSWGTMLYWASNNSALLQGAWWTIVPPGLSIAMVAFATTMLIYALDEVTNPRLRSEKEIIRVLKKFHVGSKRSTPVVHDTNP